MKSFTQLGLASTALATLFTLGLPSVQAAQSSGLHEQQHKKQQQAPARAQYNCGNGTEAVLYTREGSTMLGRVSAANVEPDWRGGDSGRESAHAYRVLQGNGDTQFGGFNDRCALADSDSERDSVTNDGVDVTKLYEKINELLEFNKRPEEADEHALLNMTQNEVHLEMDETDHLMHAFIGHGVNKTDLGSVIENAQYQWDGYTAGRERIVVEYSEKDKRYYATVGLNPADKRMGLVPDSVPLVPEPKTYAMLLTGLGLLALFKKRRGAA